MSNKAYVPKRTEDLNLSMFNMITGTNESKTLTKHISCKCKCKFDGRKYNSNQSGITIMLLSVQKTLNMWKVKNTILGIYM